MTRTICFRCLIIMRFFIFLIASTQACFFAQFRQQHVYAVSHMRFTVATITGKFQIPNLISNKHNSLGCLRTLLWFMGDALFAVYVTRQTKRSSAIMHAIEQIITRKKQKKEQKVNDSEQKAHERKHSSCVYAFNVRFSSSVFVVFLCLCIFFSYYWHYVCLLERKALLFFFI